MVEMFRRFVWTKLHVWTNAAKLKKNVAKPTSYDVRKLVVEAFRRCIWTELDAWTNAVEPASYDVINTDGWSI